MESEEDIHRMVFSICKYLEGGLDYYDAKQMRLDEVARLSLFANDLEKKVKQSIDSKTPKR